MSEMNMGNDVDVAKFGNAVSERLLVRITDFGAALVLF